MGRGPNFNSILLHANQGKVVILFETSVRNLAGIKHIVVYIHTCTEYGCTSTYLPQSFHQQVGIICPSFISNTRGKHGHMEDCRAMMSNS